MEHKTDLQIVTEGLEEMYNYMNEIDVVINLSEFNETNELLEGVTKNVFTMDVGYNHLRMQMFIK